MSPDTTRPTSRRLVIAVLVLAALLVGLWGLERASGPDLRNSRQQLAAEGLVRDGLRRLSTPHRDARGRARRRVAVYLEASGDARCLNVLRAALASHRVFQLRTSAAPEVRHLRARCTLSQPPPARGSSMAELRLTLTLDGQGITRRTSLGRQRITGYLALIPPLVAVVAALATRRILLSMLLAIFCGALVMLAGSPARLSAPVTTRLLWMPVDVVHALWWAGRHYLVGPLLAQFKLQVMIFATSLVGMIAVITRAGGTQGLLSLVGRLRGRPHLARLSVWFMGLILFFDDCANTLVVGSAARPITDAARVSREKLAYLVDSTAAPIAGVALISTWIGFEVGLFQTTADSLGLGVSGFEIFWQALPMRFYCLFTLGFVLASILLRRDYGPMLRAEQRATRTGQVRPRDSADGKPTEAFLENGGPPEGLPPAWPVAVVPISTVLLGVLGGILALGHQTPGVQLALSEGLYDLGTLSHLRDCFTQAAKEGLQGWAMLGSGLAGSAVALVLARRRQRALRAGSNALSWRELGRTYLSGGRAIMGAIGILICAWGIQAACDAMGSSVTLTAALAGNVDPTLLPLLIFATSAAIAFATGTSWGTMGILIPTVLPLAYSLGGRDNPMLLYLAAGAVLDGAIFGDHCSPISDTTVMSSLSSGCDHLEHVRTQLPYAVTVMLAAAGFGYLGHAWGLPLWACYSLGLATLMGVLWVLGKNPDAPEVK